MAVSSSLFAASCFPVDSALASSSDLVAGVAPAAKTPARSSTFLVGVDTPVVKPPCVALPKRRRINAKTSAHLLAFLGILVPEPSVDAISDARGRSKEQRR